MARRRYRFRRPPPAARIGTSRLLVALAVLLAAGAWGWGLAGYVSDIRTLLARHAFETAGAAGVPAADGIVVTTGGSGRLDAGLALLRAQRGPVLFISGVDPKVTRERIRELIPPPPGGLDDDAIACCVVLGYAARDTVGNAEEVAAWAREEGLGSLILVTSGYHLPRTLLEFRHALPEIRVEPVPVATSDVRIDAYWRYPGSFALLAAEWTKYLFARLRIALHDLLTGT